jgi:hypothetical protein
MQISPTTSPESKLIEAASAPGKNTGAARSSSPARKAAVTSESVVSKANTAAPQPETNVTFRRDSNGQIYYVLTDSQSGKELSEFPPEEVRKVGEGIAEYLKQTQAKQTSHLKVKA